VTASRDAIRAATTGCPLRSPARDRKNLRLVSEPVTARHGSWASPLSAAALATAVASIGQARAFGGRLLWTATRPVEGGRVALLAVDGAGRAEELLPPAFRVRTRVHEYGGLAFVQAGERLLFSDDADQCLYAAERGRPPAPLTPAGLRYADGAATIDGTITFFVREDHRAAGEPRNTIVAVAAVRERGLPVAYLEFEGEQHGLRRAENIERALKAELYFLGRVLGFTPADEVEPVAIANLPQCAWRCTDRRRRAARNPPSANRRPLCSGRQRRCKGRRRRSRNGAQTAGDRGRRFPAPLQWRDP
jgi:hypothetical protein